MGSHAGCRKMLKHLSDYIDGEADSAICRMIAEHSPECRPCKAFIASLRKSVRLLNKAGRRSKLPSRARRDLRKKLRECSRSLARSRILFRDSASK